MKSAAIYFGARITAAFIGFLAIALYTRLVTPEDYGVFTLVMTTALTLFALAFQWLRAGVLRFLPAEETLASPTLAATFLGFLATGLMVLVAGGIAFTSFSDPARSQLILLAIPLFLAISALEVTAAVLQARKQPLFYAVFLVARSLGTLVFSLGLVLLGYKAQGLLLGATLGHVLPVIILLVHQRRLLPDLPLRQATLRRLLIFGWPMTFVGLAGSVIAIADRYMIAWFIDVGAAGAYAAPYDLAQRTLHMLMLSAFLAFSPLVFRSFERDNEEVWQAHLHAQCRLLLATGLPAAFLLAVAAPLIGLLFFGEAFREQATQLVPWIAAGAFFQGLMAFYMSYAFTLTQRTRANALIVIAGALANVALNFIMIPLFGALGAAIATLVTYIALLGSALVISRQWILLPWPREDLGRIALALLAAAIPLYWTARLEDPIQSLLMTAAVVAGLALLFWALDVGGARRSLRNLLRRRFTSAAAA